jgi:hypothetical protein
MGILRAVHKKSYGHRRRGRLPARGVVECIRAGVEAPSYVMPFIEPYLPYYDSMRNEPAFLALPAEIQGQ